MSIKEEPKDGEANKAILNLLSKTLDVDSDDITIVRGEKTSDKIVKIKGIDYQ